MRSPQPRKNTVLRGSAIVSLVVAIGVFTGCRDSVPGPQFAYNLGDETNRLLPSTGVYHRAYDATILSGSTQATIVRFDEFDPGETPAPASSGSGGSVAPIQGAPADSVGEAFKNVGSAMIANILAGNANGNANGGAARPAGGASGSGGAASGGSPSAGSAGSADQQAINQWLADYNSDWTQRNLAGLSAHLVDRQQSVGRDYFNLLDELNGSLAAFMPLYQQVSATAASDATAKLQQAFEPLELTGLAIVGTGQAEATLRRSDGVEQPVKFEQESGTWRLVHPSVPASAGWPGLENQMQSVIDDLDDGVLDMDGGSPDPSKLAGALSRAMSILLAGSAN